MVVARGNREGEIESYCSVGTEFQLGKMKSFVHADGGGGCTTM